MASSQAGLLALLSMIRSGMDSGGERPGDTTSGWNNRLLAVV
jgi:hypothetical protein